jgi:hypothetical protein
MTREELLDLRGALIHNSDEQLEAWMTVSTAQHTLILPALEPA